MISVKLKLYNYYFRKLLEYLPGSSKNIRILNINTSKSHKLPIFVSLEPETKFEDCEAVKSSRYSHAPSKLEVLIPQESELVNKKFKIITDSLGQPHIVKDKIYSYETVS